MKTKYALVTGANRGLGKGFVDYLSTSGYFVFAGTRKHSKATSNSTNIEWVVLDVSDDKSIDRAFKVIKTKTSILDILINNAGLNKDSATNNHKEYVCNLSSLKRDSLLKMFDVNSVSPMMMTKKFLSLLKAKPSFVINISSDRASYHDEFDNSTGNYGYRSSKAAINMLTYCSTWDLPANVKTFSVHPGSVKTDMNPFGSDKPIEQARKIVQITEKWNESFNGRYLRYDNRLYPL